MRGEERRGEERRGEERRGEERRGEERNETFFAGMLGVVACRVCWACWAIWGGGGDRARREWGDRGGGREEGWIMRRLGHRDLV